MQVGGVHGDRRPGVGRIEIGGQVDEVGNGYRTVVIQITFLPGDARGAGIEVGSQVDEVGNGDGSVEIEIADAGKADLDVPIAVGVVDAGQGDAGSGVGGFAGIENA